MDTHAKEYLDKKSSNIINNERISSIYSSFISNIPNYFHITGQSHFPNIFIPAIDEEYPIQCPLSQSVIDKIASIAKPSPVGIGKETKYDKTIRNSVELNSSQFLIKSGFALSSKGNKALEDIRKVLLPQIEYIICEPYKFIIYQKDSFFLPHVDTNLGQNHFGSLVLSLPTESGYQGGEFLLNFNDKTIEWKSSYLDSDEMLCEYIAFYCDVFHEIKPITNGNRIVITFNLMIPQEIKDIDFENAMIDQQKNSSQYDYISDQLFIEPINDNHFNTFYSPFVDHVFEAISNSKYGKDFPVAVIWIILDYHGDHIIIDEITNLLNDKEFHNDKMKFDYNGIRKDCENCVCLIFQHRYSGKFLNPLTLKGRDMYLYRIFKQYFGVFLTPITIKANIGVWTDEWFDEWFVIYFHFVFKINIVCIVLKRGEWEDFEDDWEGKIIAEWEIDDKRTTWNITLGKEWFWRYPDKLKQAKINEHFSRLLVLYINKNKTLDNPKFVNGGEEYYGNCGTYDLENKYHCFGMVLTKYDESINKDDETKSKDVQIEIGVTTRKSSC